jgi:hypothetical protein
MGASETMGSRQLEEEEGITSERDGMPVKEKE